MGARRLGANRSGIGELALMAGLIALALAGCASAIRCEPPCSMVPGDLRVAPGGSEEPSASELLFACPSLSAHRAFVRDAVPAHVHDDHEETVYVIAGEGRMRLGDSWLELGPGALVHVPRGCPHAVEARTPLTALSIFTPPFDGEDRRFIEGADD